MTCSMALPRGSVVQWQVAGLWHQRDLGLDVHQLLSSCVSFKKSLSLSEPLSSSVK